MEKQMSKFIRALLGFIITTALVYFILIIFFGEFIPAKYTKNLSYNVGSAGHINSRLKEVKSIKNIDLLFLGSSHTYRGFDTRIFEKEGYSCFNLGSSSQTPLQTRVLLERYLDQLQPKLVIYEVYPVCFTLDGVEASLDLIANDRNDLASVELAIKQKHVKVYNSLLFAFYSQLFNRNTGFVEKVKKGDDTYIPGGYVERKLNYFKHEHYPKQQWDLLPVQLKAFEENLALLKKRNIKVILVQAPITKTLYNSYSNNADFDAKMKRYGTYYNFNKTTQLSDSLDFYDDDHLNQNGVQKFNKELIQQLLQK